MYEFDWPPVCIFDCDLFDILVGHLRERNARKMDSGHLLFTHTHAHTHTHTHTHTAHAHTHTGDRRLFVGMLSRNMTEEEVRAMFGRFGVVEDVSILRTAEGGSKGVLKIKTKNKTGL